MKHTATLPVPDPIAQQHSAQLLQLIYQTIEDRNGWLSFAEFMQLALYQTGLGYYSNGLSKIGKAGDFITAPEITPLFSKALGNHIADVLKQIPEADCLEFGAGSGQMASIYCYIWLKLIVYQSSITLLKRVPTYVKYSVIN